MARSIRHARNNRATGRHASQRSASHGSATTGEGSQRTTIGTPPYVEPPKKRGRLVPKRNYVYLSKVPSYINYKPPYKYTTQLGVILKREYPDLIEDKDEHGHVIGKHAALEWDDYFLNTESVETSGEHVLSEFWRLFKVVEEDQEEADRILETYLKKRVKDMMYQARVEAVKEYYRTLGQELDDKLACPIELEYDQYLKGKINWCPAEVWPELCRYWCSKEFLAKRKRGQKARLEFDDIAQNHGGSRPLAETQQHIKITYGPEKATPLNVYAVMKSGINNVDTTGRHGAIRSRKAQKRMDDYIKGARRHARPEDDERENMDEDMEEVEGGEEHVHEEHLNEQVLYDVSSGPRNHGHFAIANGAVRAADVRAAAKERTVRPSNPVSLQSMAREMARLCRANEMLQQQNHAKDKALQQYQVTIDLTLNLYRQLGQEIPENALQRLSSAQAIVSDSSHVGLESTNNSIDVDGHNGEDLCGPHIDNNIAASNIGVKTMHLCDGGTWSL